MCSVRYVPNHTAGLTGTGHFGKFGTIWIPVPSVPAQTFIPVPTLREVRYNTNTVTGHFGEFGATSYSVSVHFGKFGTTLIPVPDTSASSVRHQYWYFRYRYGRLYRSWYRYRYNIDTGTGHFGKFGTSTRYRTLHNIDSTVHFGKFGTTSIRYRTLGKFGTISLPVPSRTGMDVCTGVGTGIGTTVDTGIGTTVGTGIDTTVGTGIGTTSIPVPDTLLSSVQHQPGTGNFGKFGTISTWHRHIELRLTLQRSDSELQISTFFRSEKRVGFIYAVQYCKIRRNKI